jgi:hypothetical protein
MPWVVAALVLGWFFYNGDGDPLSGAIDTLALVTRGARLTRAPYDPDTGVVPGTPGELAAEANLTEDQYSLARMLASEEGNSDNRIKAAVCWATINNAAKLGKSITDLLINAKNSNHAGAFGTQRDIDAQPDADGNPTNPNYRKSDRYASTALDPHEGDGVIASQCLDGSIPDFTNGATHFDRPAGESNPEKIASNRAAEGLSVVEIDGIDSSVIRFWA